MLEGGGFRRGPSPFRFENMWLLTDGFLEKVKGWWGSYSVVGSPSSILAKKLKLLKEDLKVWNREVFRHLDDKKAKALVAIEEMGRLEVEGKLEEGDVGRMKEARADFLKIARMEEVSYRQKSRCLWLKEGDRNTKFFHRMANVHRRGN